MMELKACPFCAGLEHTIHRLSVNTDHHYHGVAVTCAMCGITVPVDLWNTRLIEDALRAENERYQKLMSKHIVGQCKKCNYMASWPGCTKCGTPYPESESALNGGK